MKFAPRDQSSARTLSMSEAASAVRPVPPMPDRIAAASASAQRAADPYRSAARSTAQVQPPSSPEPSRLGLQSPVQGGRVAHQRPSNATFNRGQQVFGPHDGHGLIHIVRTGCIRLYKTLPDGRSINVGLLGPNTIFAQEARGDGMTSGTSAESLTTSTLSIVEERDLARLIAASPELAMAVVSGMSRRVTEIQTLVEQLLVRDTSVRLASTLLNLAELLGRQNDHGLRAIALPLTHQSLANMIGSNRVTVTRKLIEFQRTGLVSTTGRTALAVDTQRLRDFIRSPGPEPGQTAESAESIEGTPQSGDNAIPTR